MAVDGRVDADAEDVLVVLRQCAGRDDVTPVGGLAGVDVDDGDDTGGTGFDDDAAGLSDCQMVRLRIVWDG